jgi:hypothetical protein
MKVFYLILDFSNFILTNGAEISRIQYPHIILFQGKTMKRQVLKKSTLAAAIVLALSLDSVASVSAAMGGLTLTNSMMSETKEAPQETKRKLLEERHQKVEHEALLAVTGTQNALTALNRNDTYKAVSFLQDVSEKLDTLLAKYPNLNLIPANIDSTVHDFDNDTKQVEKVIDTVEDLLEDNKVQDARQMLNQLVSEIRITTISIPLGTFPKAIKDALKLIDQGKTDEAENELYDVLNTLVKTTEIIPLPVLKAETILNEASQLEHRSDLTKETSRTEILLLADAAKDKLKMAEILGYGSKADYKLLYDAIDDIKDVIYTEKSKLAWDNIKASIKAFKNKIIHPQ